MSFFVQQCLIGLTNGALVALVALGWFGVGVAMAIFIDNMVGYVGAAAVGIICFMTLPGFYLMRQPQPGARDA